MAKGLLDFSFEAATDEATMNAALDCLNGLGVRIVDQRPLGGGVVRMTIEGVAVVPGQLHVLVCTRDGESVTAELEAI